MKLSELRIIYDTLRYRVDFKDHVRYAIKSIEHGYISIRDFENGEYIYSEHTYYSSNDYAETEDGYIYDVEDCIWCERSDSWHHVDNASRVNTRHGEEWVSDDYISSGREDFVHFNGEYYDSDAAEIAGIVYLEDCDEYGRADDSYYDEEEGYWYSTPRETYVRGYHNGHYKDLSFNNKSKYSIGFEVEKEDGEVRDSIHIDDFEEKTHNLWRKERDGSLDDEYGYELISPTFEFDINEIFDHIESNEQLVAHIDAKYTTRCGGHIHLSEKGLDGYQLFDKVKGYTPLLYALYHGRINKNYAKGKSNEDLRKENEKYQAIKIHDNRIEFRIISAVPNIKTLKWRCKLLMMILQNPTDDVIKAYYNVDTKFTKLLKQTYTDDKLVELKDRFIKFTREFEGIEINKK